MTRFTVRLVTALLCITFGSLLAQAQNQRTWVSGVGSDANPNCPRTAPCRTLSFAVSVTNPNGEVLILDPGGYATFTIDRSVTIDGTGTLAEILANTASTAVTINLLPADPLNTVRLRGLYISGAGNAVKTGIRGISVPNTNLATNLKINLEDIVIDGFTQEGIYYNANGGDLVIKNSSIRNNTKAGITVDSSDGGIAYLTLDNVSTNLNLEGVRLEDNVRAMVSHSTASNNTLNGYVSIPGTAASEMNIDSSTASNNRQTGIFSINNGAASTIRIFDVAATNNGSGLQSLNGGQICSNGDNHITAPTQPPTCVFADQ